MMENTKIAGIRREYSLKELSKSSVNKDPFTQFDIWMTEALNSDILDPSAMILATADKDAVPSIRVVLLKGVEHGGFLFYTNYLSAKGAQLAENPSASLLFFWKELERQVRISGKVEKVSNGKSEEYFKTRPYESRLGAWASEQSSEIPGRSYLEKRFEEFKEKYKSDDVPLPPHWGGYKLIPDKFEFWQGRENRLHDRISFKSEDNGWEIVRLAP